MVGGENFHFFNNSILDIKRTMPVRNNIYAPKRGERSSLVVLPNLPKNKQNESAAVPVTPAHAYSAQACIGWCMSICFFDAVTGMESAIISDALPTPVTASQATVKPQPDATTRRHQRLMADLHPDTHTVFFFHLGDSHGNDRRRSLEDGEGQ